MHQLSTSVPSEFLEEHAVCVEGFAPDGYCSNTMRSLTDKELIKHVGDARNFWTR